MEGVWWLGSWTASTHTFYLTPSTECIQILAPFPTPSFMEVKLKAKNANKTNLYTKMKVKLEMVTQWNNKNMVESGTLTHSFLHMHSLILKELKREILLREVFITVTKSMQLVSLYQTCFVHTQVLTFIFLFHYQLTLFLKDTSHSAIGIITPYREQLKLITRQLGELFPGKSFQIATVDGFQGREMDIIIFSSVRANYRYF